jgi:hypothetical protein
VLRNGHNGGVVEGESGVSDGKLDELGHGAHEAASSLVTDRENGDLGAVLGLNELANLLDESRVDTTAHTLVGGDGNDESARGGGHVGGAALHVEVSLEHHVDSVVTEVLSVFEALKVTLHLRGSDELHGLGNLTDGSDRLHAGLEHLLGGAEVAVGSGDKHSAVVEKLSVHGSCAESLESGLHIINYN